MPEYSKIVIYAISMQTLLHAGNKGYNKTWINMETLNTQHKQPSNG